MCLKTRGCIWVKFQKNKLSRQMYIRKQAHIYEMQRIVDTLTKKTSWRTFFKCLFLKTPQRQYAFNIDISLKNSNRYMLKYLKMNRRRKVFASLYFVWINVLGENVQARILIHQFFFLDFITSYNKISGDILLVLHCILFLMHLLQSWKIYLSKTMLKSLAILPSNTK